MSGKMLIEWRHGICADITKTRYMDEEISRTSHTEIVNIFFPQENEDSNDSQSETSDEKSSELRLAVDAVKPSNTSDDGRDT